MRLRLLVTLASLAVGCDPPVAVNREVVVRLEPEWLGGAATTNVDWSERQFILPGNSTSAVPIARAESLAMALSALLAADALVGNVREALAADRGAPLAFDALSLCRRVTYTFSPANAGGVGLSPYQRRSLSNQWAIPLCTSGGDAVISVAVADAPIEAQILANDIAWDHAEAASGAFRLTGLRPEFGSGLPLSPEEAAGILYRRFETRIVSGPELVSQYEETNVGRSAHCGSWRFVLENTVEAPVADGGALARDVFYVRRHPACISDEIAIFVERDSQPATFWTYLFQGTLVDSALVELHRPTRFTRTLPD